MTTNIWNKRSYIIVTGASRGIGKTIAVEFSKRLAPKSTIVLSATNLKKLNETKEEILKHNLELEVKVVQMDLSNLKQEDIDKLVSVESPQNYQLACIVHNAGTLGNMNKLASDINDLKELQDYFMINFHSMVLLNTAFLKVFPPLPDQQRLVINITSLWAIQACKNMVFYCTSKAAREMFFSVLAMDDPTLNVLNYSPGPVRTDMADQILKEMPVMEIRDQFIELRDSGAYLTTEQTVGKLIKILDANTFTSGQRMDYYDDI